MRAVTVPRGSTTARPHRCGVGSHPPSPKRSDHARPGRDRHLRPDRPGRAWVRRVGGAPARRRRARAHQRPARARSVGRANRMGIGVRHARGPAGYAWDHPRRRRAYPAPVGPGAVAREVRLAVPGPARRRARAGRRRRGRRRPLREPAWGAHRRGRHGRRLGLLRRRPRGSRPRPAAPMGPVSVAGVARRGGSPGAVRRGAAEPGVRVRRRGIGDRHRHRRDDRAAAGRPGAHVRGGSARRGRRRRRDHAAAGGVPAGGDVPAGRPALPGRRHAGVEHPPAPRRRAGIRGHRRPRRRRRRHRVRRAVAHQRHVAVGLARRGRGRRGCRALDRPGACVGTGPRGRRVGARGPPPSTGA